MNISLVIGFLPWILFGLLAHHHATLARLSALGASTLQVVLNRKSPKIVLWVAFVLFLLRTLGLVVLHWEALGRLAGLLVHLTLSLLAWGSLAIGIPFTIQYAREHVPPEHWHSPTFVRVNQILSGAWGMNFVAQTMVWKWQAESPENAVPVWISTTLTVATLIFTARFPAWYKHKQSLVESTSGETGGQSQW